jgi:hypothetical protein
VGGGPLEEVLDGGPIGGGEEVLHILSGFQPRCPKRPPAAR